MNSAQARNCYQQTESHAEIHPVKLIHLMYERVLSHLLLTGEGIEKDDPKLRGESLGKAIALVAELNASIREEDDSEPAKFLRGLYGAILQELPKVAVNNDLQILDVAKGYIERLKEIWEQTAMQEAGLTVGEKVDASEAYGAGAMNEKSAKKGDVVSLSISA